MKNRRLIEIFSAGCTVCEETIRMVEGIACSSCEVSVLDMKDPEVATRAKGFGISTVPAVVIDGKLVECCAGRSPDEASLRAAGIGKTLD